MPGAWPLWKVEEMARQATPGRRAPDFELPATDGAGANQTTVCLEDYEDQWLMLMFYPRDFTMI